MIESDKKKLAKELLACGEVYGREVTSGLVETFFSILESYSIEIVARAFHQHMIDSERGRFFPKPADLIDKISGGSREQAVQSWAEVIRLSSNSRTAKSQNEVTEAVVAQMGGWRRMGQTDYAQFEWLQKEFVERYQALSKRPEQARDELARLGQGNLTRIFVSTVDSGGKDK